MPQYTSAPSTSGYAAGLRSYAPNKFGGGGATQSGMVGGFAPHLYQQPNMDPDYLATYRSLGSDPNVPANQTFDIDKVWRYTPTNAMFKPGFQHSDYIEQKVQALRADRETQARLASGEYRYNDNGMLVQGRIDPDTGLWQPIRGPSDDSGD